MIIIREPNGVSYGHSIYEHEWQARNIILFLTRKHPDCSFHYETIEVDWTTGEEFAL